MKLPKESLARELERRDNMVVTPIVPVQGGFDLPCYHKDGICTNPHHDCINCPRTPSIGGITTNTMKEIQ